MPKLTCLFAAVKRLVRLESSISSFLLFVVALALHAPTQKLEFAGMGMTPVKGLLK